MLVWTSMEKFLREPIFHFFFIFLFFNFTILYWFCRISTWICHRYTCVPHPEPSSQLPPHIIPLGHPSAPAPSILYPASNLDWQFVSYMTHKFYVRDRHVLIISPPHLTTVFLSKSKFVCLYLSSFELDFLQEKL